MAIRKDFSPVPPDTLILGADQYYSMDEAETRTNNLVLLVGRSGSSKTRGFIIPNLLQMHGSYVVTDPKGQLYKRYHQFFKDNGYAVHHLDFRHPETSDHWNPFSFIKNTNDIRKMSHLLTYAGDGLSFSKRCTTDPFWDLNAEAFISGCIGKIVEDVTENRPKNMRELLRLVELANRERGLVEGRTGERYGSRLNVLFEKHQAALKKDGKTSWALKQFNKCDASPDKTYQTIVSTVSSKLTEYDTEELLQMLSKSDFELKNIGTKRTIVFVECSDTDRSTDSLINLFFNQTLSALINYADEECPNGKLPISVEFVMDDFCSNCILQDWDKVCCNGRSRGLSAICAIQDEAVIKKAYGEAYATIISNTSNYVFLGSNELSTAQAISKRTNKPLSDVLYMPLDEGYLFRTGMKPQRIDIIDLEAFEAQKGLQKQPLEANEKSKQRS